MSETISAVTATPTAPFLERTPFGVQEAYAWDRCTVTLTLTLHPEDGDPKGRLVSLAAWTHADAPIVLVVRRADLGSAWPLPIKEILGALRQALPDRERLAQERRRIEKEKAASEASAEVKRKETAAAQRAQAKAAAKHGKPAKPKTPTPTPKAKTALKTDGGKPQTETLTPPPAVPAVKPAEAQGSLFDTTPEVKEEVKHGEGQV